MHASLPSSRVADRVVFSILSSSGKESYPVTVVRSGAGVICPCRGYSYYGRCRHSSLVRGWLEAVIPAGALPE